MRKVLEIADGGAASPPKTHTRLLPMRAGLPRSENRIEILDEVGFVARADRGWKRWKVLVEYDGAHHWTDRKQRTLDIGRYALLPELGWTVIRVGAGLLYHRPFSSSGSAAPCVAPVRPCDAETGVGCGIRRTIAYNRYDTRCVQPQVTWF